MQVRREGDICHKCSIAAARHEYTCVCFGGRRGVYLVWMSSEVPIVMALLEGTQGWHWPPLHPSDVVLGLRREPVHREDSFD